MFLCADAQKNMNDRFRRFLRGARTRGIVGKLGEIPDLLEHPLVFPLPQALGA